MLHALYHWVAWWWGGDGQGGPAGTGYLIASGILADVSLFTAAVVFVWSHLCSEPGCYRPARRMAAKDGEPVCSKHWRLGLPKPAWDAIPEIRELCERWAAARDADG